MDCILMMWGNWFTDYRHDVCQVQKKIIVVLGLKSRDVTDDIKPFPKVRSQEVTRVSKSEKAIEVYYQDSNFWEKEDTMKKRGSIFLR